jgi:16S rRNA G1207 methylase RsmC
MALKEFDAIVELVGEDVGPNFAMSNLQCCEAMRLKMTVAIGTRLLAFGNYNGIMTSFSKQLRNWQETQKQMLNSGGCNPCKCAGPGAAGNAVSRLAVYGQITTRP